MTTWVYDTCVYCINMYVPVRVIPSISCKGIQGRLKFVIKMDDFMFNRYFYLALGT